MILTNELMKCLINYIEQYCKNYHLNLSKPEDGFRLKGVKLINIKILVYILRLYFNCSYDSISKYLNINRHSAILFYFSILGNPIYRHIAETRHKEITNSARNL